MLSPRLLTSGIIMRLSRCSDLLPPCSASFHSSAAAASNDQPVIKRALSNPQLIDMSRAGPAFDPSGLVVIPNAISQEEHDAMLEDVRKPLRRVRLGKRVVVHPKTLDHTR